MKISSKNTEKKPTNFAKRSLKKNKFCQKVAGINASLLKKLQKYSKFSKKKNS